MDIVDELMTPGCPQCAIKHLSAALYHKAKQAGETTCPDPYMVDVCVAYINLVEVRTGYHSHLWYAVGALVRAEERFAPRIGECVAREARLMLEHYGETALIDALNCIEAGTVPGHEDWATAHFDEAVRELPAFANEMRMDDLIGSIERIREEFFNLSPSTVPGDDETNKTEKEPDMATAKKAAPKGAKCADKGGKTTKCAKCAAKGGKTATKACDKGGKAKK